MNEEKFEQKICTCGKKNEWLEENGHYAFCPVLSLGGLLAAERQVAAEEKLKDFRNILEATQYADGFVGYSEDEWNGAKKLCAEFLRHPQLRSRQPNQSQ